LFQEEDMANTLEDMRGDSPAKCEDFNKIKEEAIRAAGGNPNEVWRMLTGIIPPKKRVVGGIIPPKKPLVLGTKNSGNINKNQEKQEESRKTKKQRKNPTEIKQEVPDRPPCIPTEFKDKIMGLRGSDINLVIQKELTSTDTNASQARLSIPRGQMRYDFLSREEVIRAAGGNPNEVWRMLTGIVPPKKRVVGGIIPPKKPLVLGTKNSGNINKNQEKQEESRKTKKQRKNPTKIKQEVPDRPPCIPTEFKDKIMGLRGSDINLVIQKELTSTDTNASQARLSIPRGQMRYDFLSREEQVSLDEKEGTSCIGMEVPLIEPSLQVSTIFLKKWKNSNRVNKNYTLSKPWIKVTERNQLKPSNTIQLWSFRVDQKLHLALIKLEN
jgi:nitrate reductase cytochrome c-type subunit